MPIKVDRMPKTKIKLLEPYEKELISKGARKKGLIITVCGFSGSGKSSVVKMLMEAFPKLKLVYSGGIFRENAKREGMTLEEYCKTRSEKDDIDADKEVLRRSLGGNAIVDSRLAGWCLGGWADARIFVTCPMELRTERIAKREDISVKEAKARILKRDNSDAKRYKGLYGIDVNDLSIYDFIIDNSGSLEELEKGVKKVAGEIGKRL